MIKTEKEEMDIILLVVSGTTLPSKNGVVGKEDEWRQQPDRRSPKPIKKKSWHIMQRWKKMPKNLPTVQDTFIYYS